VLAVVVLSHTGLIESGHHAARVVR
jgi:hypothetical protein